MDTEILPNITGKAGEESLEEGEISDSDIEEVPQPRVKKKSKSSRNRRKHKRKEKERKRSQDSPTGLEVDDDYASPSPPRQDDCEEKSDTDSPTSLFITIRNDESDSKVVREEPKTTN